MKIPLSIPLVLINISVLILVFIIVFKEEKLLKNYKYEKTKLLH